MLEAAVHGAERSLGHFDHGTGRTGFELELDAEHAASRRPVEPVDEPATGFVHQRHCDAATGRLEHASEVMIS
jgi:hypothetical protein